MEPLLAWLFLHNQCHRLMLTHVTPLGFVSSGSYSFGVTRKHFQPTVEGRSQSFLSQWHPIYLVKSKVTTANMSWKVNPKPPA